MDRRTVPARVMASKIMDYQKARQIILQNNRAMLYFGLIIICSLISLPEDYKVDKRNLLNQWFVKLGWFWTNLFMLPIMFFSTKPDDKELVSQTIFRLLSCTLLWYCSTNLFELIDSMTGFDISGHTFLLMFSNLLITSELKLLDVRYKKSTHGRADYLAKLEENNKAYMNKIKLSVYVLTILWDFMILQTAFYYHTILQKVIASGWAIGSWYIIHLNFYHHHHQTTTTRP